MKSLETFTERINYELAENRKLKKDIIELHFNITRIMERMVCRKELT